MSSFFNVKSLSAGQLHTLTGQIVSTLRETSFEDDPFSATTLDVLTDCEKAHKAMGIAIGAVQSSVFTERKTKADELRDARLGVIVGTLQNTADDPDAEADARAAAKRLLAIFARRTPSFHHLGYADNTSELKVLLEDWGKPEAAADLATLGLTSRIAKLAEAQAAFLTLIDEQATTDAEDAEADDPTRREAQDLIREHFRTLFTLLTHHAQKDHAPYRTLDAKVESLVAEQLAIARRRESLDAKEETEETNADESGAGS